MRPAASIRPTALGVKGVLLFVALELAFFATDYSNLFFLLLAFSSALGVLGAAWSWQNLRNVRVGSLQVELAAAGCQRPVGIRLTASAAPRFDVAVELPLAGEHVEIAHAPMLRGETSLMGQLPPQRRGRQQAEYVRLTSRFPFGLLRVSRRVPLHVEVVTYPAPAPCEGAARDGRSDGDRGTPLPGRGDSVAGLRSFRTGDAVGDVSWKATARRGDLVVKQREHERQACVEFLIDRRRPLDELEAALSRAATLTLAARRDTPTRLLSQGADWTVDPQRGGADDALRWLAAASPLPADADPPRTGARRGGAR